MAYAFNDNKSKQDLKSIYDWIDSHDKFFGTTFISSGTVTTNSIYANQIFLANSKGIYGRLTTGTTNYLLLQMSAANNIVIGTGSYAGYANVNIYAGTGAVQLLTKNGTLYWDGSTLRPTSSKTKALGNASYVWEALYVNRIVATSMASVQIASIKDCAAASIDALTTARISAPSGATTLTGTTLFQKAATFQASVTCESSLMVSGNLTVNGTPAFNRDRIRCQPSYDNTTTYAANLYVGSSGIFSRHYSGSSRTIKTDIKPLMSKPTTPIEGKSIDSDISAECLYDVDVIQFKYKDGIITDESDVRVGKNMPGFIIEDLDEKYPISVNKPSDNVKEWSWNYQYLIPPMLKLIQDQKKEIDALKKVNSLQQS